MTNLFTYARSGFALAGILAVSAFMLVLPGAGHAQQTIGHVTWSPDGKYLAFYTRWYGNTEVFLLELESGDLLQQTVNDAADSAPDFTSDGEHLLYASDESGDFDIYRVDLVGGKPEKLFGKAGLDERFPFELADGRIAYASRRIQEDKDADPFPFKIHAWDPSTGQSTPLTKGDSEEMIFRSAAEGDDYLLVSNRSGKNEIYLTSADATIRRQMTNNTADEGFGSAFPRFSKDGKKFLYWGDQDTDAPFSFFLKIYDLETNETTVLPRPVRYTALADLSPDGTQVAFAAATEEEGLSGTWHLYVMDIDGANLRLLY